jgi:hypothetical protein
MLIKLVKKMKRKGKVNKMNIIRKVIENVILTVVALLVAWSAGSSIYNSIVTYGFVVTLLTLLIGIPIMMGAMALFKIVERKIG